jgi:hypothetical protein
MARLRCAVSLARSLRRAPVACRLRRWVPACAGTTWLSSSTSYCRLSCRLLSSIALLAITAAAPAFAADTSCQQEVRFAKGASAATLDGQLKGYDYCDYIVQAAKGQRLRTVLSGKNRNRVQAALFGRLERGLNDNEPVVLPETGQYTVRVLMPRTFARRGRTASYRLHIRIDPAAADSAGAPASGAH